MSRLILVLRLSGLKFLTSFTGYFLCLYRPPRLTSSFFVDFHVLLEDLFTIHREFFNLHLDTQSTARYTFNDILASFDLKQHISPHTFMITGLFS